jgi:hypothetical protein|tara:strand:- start:1412 stop:1663 length:252 start_codon:yes stop_codon:yes gene_type:complete
MNTEKLMNDIDKCENEEEMKKVFNEHFEDEVERKMMWDLLKTLRDKDNSQLLDKESKDNENDFMKDIVDTVTKYDEYSKKKKN